MNRFALLWSLGIIATLKLRGLPQFSSKSLWVCVLLLVAVGYLTHVQVTRQRHPLWQWRDSVTATLRAIKVLLPLLAGAAWVVWVASTELDARLNPDYHGVDMIVHGSVVGIPDVQPYRTRFDLQVNDVTALDGQDLTRVVGVRTVRLSWYERAPVIQPGQVWQLQVRLKEPSSYANPGSFDYTGWLFSQRIHATGYVRRAADNRVVRETPALLSSLRVALSARVMAHHDQLDYAGLLQALITGVRQGVTDEQRTLLQQTGTSHLLAISGLHIGMLAGSGWLLGIALWWLLPRRRCGVNQHDIGCICALVAACFYAALAGFTLPTQRALIMLSAVLLCRLLRRHNSVASPILLALGLVLLADPLAPVAAGFWLSFGAVLFLMVLSARSGQPDRLDPNEIGWARKALRRLLAAVRVHLGLTLLMFPVTGFFFGQSSLISPLANFIAIPLVGVAVVPPLVFWVPLSLVSEEASRWWLFGIDRVLGLLMATLGWLADLPFAAITVSGQSTFVWSLLLLVLPLLFLGSHTGARWLAVSLAYPFLAALMFAGKPHGLTVTVLDVGQGQAIVVQTPNHTLLYDTGGGRAGPHSLASRVVLPFLRHEGIHTLDMLLVSHWDSDHSAGERDVVRALSPHRVVGGRSPGAVPCHQMPAWQWDSVHFTMLHPTPDFLEANGTVSDNDGSCVLLISYAGQRILIPGDIEAETEQYVLNQLRQRQQSASHTTAPGPVSVMISPHHGSDTSSTNAWVEAWGADRVIHSVGYRNRWGFPHESVQMRYTLSGAQNYSTDRSGAITLRFDDTGRALPAVEHRQTHRRLWSTDRQ